MLICLKPIDVVLYYVSVHLKGRGDWSRNADTTKIPTL